MTFNDYSSLLRTRWICDNDCDGNDQESTVRRHAEEAEDGGEEEEEDDEGFTGARKRSCVTSWWVERGERNREAAPELVIMLIRMICGSPQTDEEQQEEEKKKKKKKNTSRGRRGESEASSDVLTGCSIRASHIYFLSFSLFLPFFLIDTFLPSFCPLLFRPLPRVRSFRASIRAHCSSPRDEQEEEKEKERKIERIEL